MTDGSMLCRCTVGASHTMSVRVRARPTHREALGGRARPQWSGLQAQHTTARRRSVCALHGWCQEGAANTLATWCWFCAAGAPLVPRFCELHTRTHARAHAHTHTHLAGLAALVKEWAWACLHQAGLVAVWLVMRGVLFPWGGLVQGVTQAAEPQVVVVKAAVAAGVGCSLEGARRAPADWGAGSRAPAGATRDCMRKQHSATVSAAPTHTSVRTHEHTHTHAPGHGGWQGRWTVRLHRSRKCGHRRGQHSDAAGVTRQRADTLARLSRFGGRLGRRLGRGLSHSQLHRQGRQQQHGTGPHRADRSAADSLALPEAGSKTTR
jgi:hypothetical protein